MNVIRTTITKSEFEKLTWMNLEDVASDINDIMIELIGNMVKISVLGYELKEMSVSDYKGILNS
jgi:hypothetical protein